MAADFLETTYDCLFFIDADIEFKPKHVAALWNLQDKHDTGVTVGIYPMKKPNAPYAAWKDGQLTDLDEFTEPTVIDYAGTGFMLIHRRVFEIMKGRTEIAHVEANADGSLRTLWDFFPCGIHDGYYESEDFGFCRRWRETGGSILMDPSVRLIHHGTYAYGGQHAD